MTQDFPAPAEHAPRKKTLVGVGSITIQEEGNPEASLRCTEGWVAVKE